MIADASVQTFEYEAFESEKVKGVWGFSDPAGIFPSRVLFRSTVVAASKSNQREMELRSLSKVEST